MKSYLMSLTILLLTLTISCGNSKPKEDKEENQVVEVEQIEVLEPVHWKSDIQKTGDNEYTFTYTATIDEGWYVYSSKIDADGPIPTSLNIEENEDIAEVGEMQESSEHVKEGYDEMFDMDIKKFSHEATFTQTVKLKKPTKLIGYFEYMTCDSTQCIFPDPLEFEYEAK